MDKLLEYIPWAITAITAFGAYITGSAKQSNDVFKEMQSTIKQLNDDNKKLYEELSEMRRKQVELETEITKLNKRLLHENK